MRRYIVFGLAGLSLFMTTFAATSVSVAFPTILKEMNSSLVVTGWVFAGYQLTAICTVLIAGRLSDSYGKKLTFGAFISLFTVGSVMSALAPNVELLIVARLMQGAGGGGMIPIGTGIIADEFVNSRQKAIGLYSSLNPAGAVLGPNIGGWLVTLFGWRSVFWLNLPFGIIVIALGFWLLKGKTRDSKFDVDVFGLGMLVTGVASFMIALSMLNVGGQPLWGLVALFAMLSAGMLFSFFRHEKKLKNPILDPNLLFSRPFRHANYYNFVLGSCYFGIFQLIPLYATTVYGMSVLESGVILTPRSLGQIATSGLCSFMLLRWGYRKPILAGTLVLALTIFLLALEPANVSILGVAISPTVLMLFLMLLAGTSIGMAIPAANNACIELMPDHIATISGLRGMFRQLGGSLCITISTLVIQFLGNAQLAFTIVLAGVGVLFLAVLPSVFIMPASPHDELKSVARPSN